MYNFLKSPFFPQHSCFLKVSFILEIKLITWFILRHFKLYVILFCLTLGPSLVNGLESDAAPIPWCRILLADLAKIVY